MLQRLSLSEFSSKLQSFVATFQYTSKQDAKDVKQKKVDELKVHWEDNTCNLIIRSVIREVTTTT